MTGVQHLAARMAQMVLVVLFVTSTLFVLLRLTGDPVLALLGPNPPRAEIQAKRAELHLDDSYASQFVAYMGRLARLDFGRSFVARRSAIRVVWDHVPESALLAVCAMAFAVLVGVPLGAISAVAHGSWLDPVIATVTLILQSIPSFALGILLITVFAVDLGWLPSFGADKAQGLILPTITLGAYFLSRTSRLVRSTMIAALRQDYVRTAHAKGLAPLTVVRRHVARNAMIPVLTIVAVDFGHLLGGAVVVETVFAWPGVGRQLILALQQRDYTVVQTTSMLLAAAIVLTNLVADLLYTSLDPRIRV
jgi:peptide/nickel transport system permease protein